MATERSMGNKLETSGILASIPGLDVESAEVRLLKGGVTNRNYTVWTPDARYVLRVGGPNLDELGIDRARERSAATVCAERSISPEVTAFLQEPDALLRRYVYGETLTPGAANRNDTLKRIVKTLRHLHNAPDFPGTFSPFEAVRGFHRHCLRRGVVLPPEMDQALQSLDGIEEDVWPPPVLRPCHNELRPGNLIDSQSHLWLIDLEYAAMGDPCYDVGSLCANLELSPGNCRLLVTYYFSRDREEDLVRVDLLRMVCDLREALWGFLQSGLSQAKFDFRTYAWARFSRFMTAAKDSGRLPQTGRVLKAARPRVVTPYHLRTLR